LDFYSSLYKFVKQTKTNDILWAKAIKRPAKGKFSGVLMEKDALNEKTKETNLQIRQITNKSSRRELLF
jgi:hypothetical protein